MKSSTIRYIDKKIGQILCFLLTLHRKVCSIFRQRNIGSQNRPSRILFIKLVEQGSTVLAFPALKRAADLVGKNNLYFLVFRENRPILDILNIIPHDNIMELNSETFAAFIISSLQALAKIRKKGIDSCIDMEFFSRASAILSYASGAKKRVGIHRFNSEGPYRGDLFTHKLLYNPYVHTGTFFLTLTEALNYTPVSNSTPLVFPLPAANGSHACFSPTDEEKKSIINKIEVLKQSPLSRPVFILNPNTSDLLPIRRWPWENFVKLGRLLSERFAQGTIIISGTLQEKDAVEKITSQIKGAVSLAGETSLRDLLTLYTIADVLVTNDSGPAHFAALTPIRAVVLFGPETPLLYGQTGNRILLLHAPFVCSPCVNVYNQRQSPCKDAICLKSIKVEEVFAAVMKFIDGCF